MSTHNTKAAATAALDGPEPLIQRLRALEAEHAPDGWPAVQMRDVSALLDELAATRAALAAAGAPATVPSESPALRAALEIRTASGWSIGAGPIPVLYTDEINGQQVMRDDVWLCRTEHLKAPATVQPLTDDARDAARYRALRDDALQHAEDDPSVTDDSFNTFFGEDLDREADALIERHTAWLAAKEGAKA